MTITEGAARHLAVLLDQAKAGDDVAVRIAPGERGWVMQLDQPEAGDRSFDHEGRTVLLVAAEAVEALGEAQLDVREVGGGVRLVLTEAEG